MGQYLKVDEVLKGIAEKLPLFILRSAGIAAIKNESDRVSRWLQGGRIISLNALDDITKRGYDSNVFT